MLNFITLVIPMVLLYTGQNFFSKMYSQSRDGEGSLQFSVLYGAIAGICTFALNGFSFHPSKATLILGLVNAFMLLMYNVSLQKSATLGPYAFLMVFSLSGAMVLPIFYDVLILRSHLELYQIIATVLIIAACIAMNLGSGCGGKKSVKFLVWCVILALSNGFYSIIMNLQQRTLQAAVENGTALTTERCEMIITTFMTVAVATGIVQLAGNGKKFIGGFRMSKKSMLYLLASAVCATFAVNLLLFAMGRMNLTVLNVSDNGGVLIFSALISVIFLKEKLDVKGMISLIAACVGIVMLSL